VRPTPRTRPIAGRQTSAVTVLALAVLGLAGCTRAPSDLRPEPPPAPPANRIDGFGVAGIALPAMAGFRPAEERLGPRVLVPDPRTFVLRQGDEGAAVTYLQQRLADLHYDLDGVDGMFGPSTHHAVVAFQKVHGMKRSGVVGRGVWARLDSAKAPKPKYDLRGRYIEVSVTHQVLYYVVAGKVDRVLDASTGHEQWFEVDGEMRLGHTARGSFQIYKQIPGWNMSSVGGMYDSSFFIGREAIHGYPDVPPYPASHGCVRVTIDSVGRLWPEMTMGLRVFIYD
jgi:hypothetical protein